MRRGRLASENDVSTQIKALLNSFFVQWVQHLVRGFTTRYATFLDSGMLIFTEETSIYDFLPLGNETSQTQKSRSLFSRSSFIKSSDVTGM